MRTYTWDEYYEKFYVLAEAVRLLSRREEDIWLQEEKPGIKGHLFAIILGLINGGEVRKRWWQLWK